MKILQTFILITLPFTTILPPLVLTLIVRPLSLNTLNYLPSGPTATVFALLAQYYATIPAVFRYRISTTASSSANAATPANTNNSDNDPPTRNTASKPPPPKLSILLSDKSTTYIIAAQLALSQFPAMLLPSAIGWVVGMAWRAELFPSLSPSATGFHIPAWIFNERERRSGIHNTAGERERYEDLRRRLEGEAAASTSGIDSADGQRRRNVNSTNNSTDREGNGGLMERLRGAW